jgi:hypothetical protein
MIVLAALPARAGTYLETFDEDAAWFKSDGMGGMTDLNAKACTNALTALFSDRFSADLARRTTTAAYSRPYAWELGQGLHWVRYECTIAVVRFSVRLARAAGDAPDLQIRCSDNDGVTYALLYSGTDLLAAQPTNTYVQYVSPSLQLVPRAGRRVVLEINKLQGAPLFVDDWNIEYVDPPSSVVTLAAPTPAVTGSVAAPIAFASTSLAGGAAQIGYGRTPENAGWTWLDAGVTSAAIGYTAARTQWFMPGQWFYAARWVLSNGGATNYGWTAQGQYNAGSLTQAVYSAWITNDAWSTVWSFGYPDTTMPTQDVVGAQSALRLTAGLSSNLPGHGAFFINGFPAARSAATNLTCLTHRLNRYGVGFCCMARRGVNGPTTIDLEFSADGSAWYPWIVGATLDQTNAWYMLGGRTNVFDQFSVPHVRLIAYGGAGDAVELGGVQFTAPLPENAWHCLLLACSWLTACGRLRIHCCERGLA